MNVAYMTEIQLSSHPFVMSDGLDEQRGVVYVYCITIPE